MTMRLGLAVLVAALLLVPAAYAQEAAPVSVAVDRERIATSLGGKFTFRSTVTNEGSSEARGLVAHLNVLSLKEGPYVDPEDWSSNRTQYLAPLAAGESVSVAWSMQAVNGGDFGVYVAVLPETGVARPPTTGPAIHLVVAERRTLNAGGILPLALGIPAALGLLTIGLQVYRRR